MVSCPPYPSDIDDRLLPRPDMITSLPPLSKIDPGDDLPDLAPAVEAEIQKVPLDSTVSDAVSHP